MKVFKKLVAIAVAAVTSLCGLQVVSAGASEPSTDIFPSDLRTSYSTCDINRDGSVDIMDYIRIDKYFKSQCYTGSNYILDANRNHIISAADTACVWAKIYNHTYGCMVAPLTNTFNEGTTSYNQYPNTNPAPKSFLKHNYVTGQSSSYTLSLTENFSTNDMQGDIPRTAGVFGSDDRVTYANQGIVRTSNAYGTGTGFIVSDHVIATAAHCIYDPSKSGDAKWLPNLKVYKSTSSGFVSSEELHVVEAHIPENFDTTSLPPTYDYALITVQESLSDLYHFNLGIPYAMYDSSIFTSYFGSYNVFLAGFSRYPVGSSVPQNDARIYRGTGHIPSTVPSSPYSNYFCFDSDGTHGCSGGPVYVNEEYYIYNGQTLESVNDLTVVGIYANIYPNFNASPMFDAYTIYFYKNNPHIVYTVSS